MLNATCKSMVETAPTETAVAIENVFRRLLANLLIDYNSPKFREVRLGNKVVQKYLADLPSDYSLYLFRCIGFHPSSDGETLIFQGSQETLMDGDKVLTAVENEIAKERNQGFGNLDELSRQRNRDREEQRKSLLSNLKGKVDPVNDEEQKLVFNCEDFNSVVSFQETARRTLLNTGRLRNYFFEAKDFSLRRMVSGRVYACSEKCDNQQLEAHWHLHSGSGLLYSFVAHLNEDATTVLHVGIEYGYQYNSLPGTTNFKKTVLFSRKLLSADGSLALNEHPNKPCDACIYCGIPFSKLFL